MVRRSSRRKAIEINSLALAFSLRQSKKVSAGWFSRLLRSMTKLVKPAHAQALVKTMDDPLDSDAKNFEDFFEEKQAKANAKTHPDVLQEGH